MRSLPVKRGMNRALYNALSSTTLMRTTITTIALALTSTAAFAVNTCDTMPTKKQREDCWSNLIGNYLAEADEYTFAVTESKKVPATVKRNVEKKRQAIPFDAQAQCRKDSM